ncbi:hypothetical protein Cni_G21706 [Canna indica]|uniref:NAC domain-containing protein n=1 Tax=Canna indica TaxID=4628 RepID=A0AAQ3KSV9_9LILI|nr:hypothetical protein Cni_G21706 [Canna indica]
MGLRDIESTLPPGFRFYPSDEELVCHYLQKKVANERVSEGTMVEVDLHTREPWELPDVAKLSANEWYFFSFRDRKYATGSRTNRATRSGYWKATGKDRTVYEPRTHAVVGMRKTLVFYSGRAPNGLKTNWVMHEFRLESSPHSPPKEDWVLCRVFHKKKGESMSSSSFENDQDNYTNNLSSYLEASAAAGHGGHQMYGAGGQGCAYEQMCSSFAVAHDQQQQEEEEEGNSLLNLAALQYNFLGFPADEMDSARAGAGGEDYGMMMHMDDHDDLLANLGGGKDQLFF